MQLRELIHQNLGRMANDVAAALKESVSLVVGRQSEEAISRLGGRPNLPPQIKWPTWNDEPLAFVAQLDLSTIPKISGLQLPSRGSLFFFFEGGENSWGFSPKDQGSSRVLFISNPLSKFPLRALPDELEDHLRFQGVQVNPGSPETSIPDIQDQVLTHLDMILEERERYLDFLDQVNEGKSGAIHRVGGYPDCIQGDPKLKAQLVSHGLYCGDASGYQKGKKQGLWPGAVEWELLLQVDSEEKAKMMWGDVGRIYFLIHKSDLLGKRFDKTWLVFQCS